MPYTLLITITVDYIRSIRPSLRTFFSTTIVLLVALLLYSNSASADEKELTNDSPEGLDVVLLMDASGSMLTTDSLRLRDQGAKLFLQFIKAGDRLGIVQFAGEANVLQPLHDYDPAKSAEAEATINKVTTDGIYTDLLTGIQAAADQLQKTDGLMRQNLLSCCQMAKWNQIHRWEVAQRIRPNSWKRYSRT